MNNPNIYDVKFEGAVGIDNNVLEFIESFNRDKPPPANKILIPDFLAESKAENRKLYGYLHDDTGVHLVVSSEKNGIAEKMNAGCIGFIGNNHDFKPPFVQGRWSNGLLEFFFHGENGSETKLSTEIYSASNDVFSRNKGLLESSDMNRMCAVICGCGSVGSSIALHLAKSGVGSFVLIDNDIMEIYNVCRHQCDLTDVGKFKVDAVEDRIVRINPNAKVTKFYKKIQDIEKAKLQEIIPVKSSIVISSCDNRSGNAFASDLAFDFGIPFASLGFMTRAWAGEIFTSLPEKDELCYRCAFNNVISKEIENERANHFYVSEEHIEKYNFEPGLDVDIEFGVTLFLKVILDILNRHKQGYSPRIYHELTQYTIFSGTDDKTYADKFWKRIFNSSICFQRIKLNIDNSGCKHCAKI